LVGIAIDQGKLRLDERALDLLPGRTFANLDERKQAMTVAHLLTMSSGLDWAEGNPAYQAMYNSGDWVKYVLDEPMDTEPGSEFVYCSGCSHVLAAIVESATGMDTLDFARQYLFDAIGISDVQWELDAQGISIGGWGLNLTPRQMARLGYLYLRGGQWQGSQVVSGHGVRRFPSSAVYADDENRRTPVVEWVDAATRVQMDLPGDGLDYGYQWWIDKEAGGYAAIGMYGQMVYVLPRLDLVVVFTARENNSDREFQLIREYIIPAARE
jgi:CubicO group peptidase (beta-lactamase class C family)